MGELVVSTSSSFEAVGPTQLRPLHELVRTVSLPFQIEFYSDFDGTISDVDSLKALLNEFALPEWKQVEVDLQEGRVSEKEGLQKAFDLIKISPDDAKAFIREKVRIDPTFLNFARWCRRQSIGLSILSGGFRSFIDLLFRETGFLTTGIKIEANDFVFGQSGWKIKANATRPLCHLCNHCKTAVLNLSQKNSQPTLSIYAGDGHTDKCAIQLAHLIFAKSGLESHCQDLQIEYRSFVNFEEIQIQLNQLLVDISNFVKDSEMKSLTEVRRTAEDAFGWRLGHFLESAIRWHRLVQTPILRRRVA